MQPLKERLTSTINHLHIVFETHVIVAICRRYWDQIGQDVLSFLENRKENRSWYKGSRIAVSTNQSWDMIVALGFSETIIACKSKVFLWA
ncbi:hypothetical protein REPUB_Repub07fG0073300 [Reevesia pubescens]